MPDAGMPSSSAASKRLSAAGSFADLDLESPGRGRLFHPGMLIASVTRGDGGGVRRLHASGAASGSSATQSSSSARSVCHAA